MSSSSSGMNTRESLLAELGILLHSIAACRTLQGVQNTIRAVGHYLSVHGDQIPWLRVYWESPLWQQRSLLLNDELDKDTVLRGGPIVFCTLIVPHSRKDLRVGGWHSKGNKQEICNRFFMTKLYYTGDPNRAKEDGITLLEFVPKMDGQHHVAICVLHRRDYRHLIQYLRQAADQPNLPGNQADQMVVPQHLAPVNLAQAAAGIMNSPDISYTYSEPNPPGNQANQMVVPHQLAPVNLAHAAAGIMNSPDISYTYVERDIPGGNLANQTTPQYMAQLFQQPYLDHMNARPRIDYTTINPDPTREHVEYVPHPENYVINHYNSDLPTNVGMHHMTSGNIQTANLGCHDSHLYNGSMYANTSLGYMDMNARYDPSLETYIMNPPNTLVTNGSVYDMTSLDNIGMSVRYPLDASNYSEYEFNTWPWNNIMHEAPLASDNVPVLPTNFSPGADSVATEQNNNEDGCSMFLNFQNTVQPLM